MVTPILDRAAVGSDSGPESDHLNQSELLAEAQRVALVACLQGAEGTRDLDEQGRSRSVGYGDDNSPGGYCNTGSESSVGTTKDFCPARRLGKSVGAGLRRIERRSCAFGPPTLVGALRATMFPQQSARPAQLRSSAEHRSAKRHADGFRRTVRARARCGAGRRSSRSTAPPPARTSAVPRSPAAGRASGAR